MRILSMTRQRGVAEGSPRKTRLRLGGVSWPKILSSADGEQATNRSVSKLARAAEIDTLHPCMCDGSVGNDSNLLLAQCTMWSPSAIEEDR